MIRYSTNILLGTCLFLTCPEINSQSFQVFKEDDQFVCMDDPDRTMIHKSASASEVIQFAVDRCNSEKAGNILLGKGSFALDAPVRLKNNIWLHGKRRGTELVVKPGVNEALQITGADNIHISEMTIRSDGQTNYSTGIYGAKSNHCTVNDVYIFGFGNAGISFVHEFHDLNVYRCTFIDNEQSHIYLSDNESAGGQKSSVTNCTFYCGGFGIIAQKEGETSPGVEIADNIFAQLKGMAIDSNFDSTRITGNKLYWIGLHGMRTGSNDFMISGNINSWIRGHGLVLDGARNGSVVGNNFTDVGVRSRDGLRKCGIAIYESSNLRIVGNSIWNFGDQGKLEYAVYEDPGCSNNLVTGNTGWFHANPEAFKLNGSGTTKQYNTSNRGEYRNDDYWDYTQKYGYPAEKFLETLYPEDPKVSAAEENSSLEKFPVCSEEFDGEKIIENRDMFEQVITVRDHEIKKFGWTGNPAQIWKISKEGPFYLIRNLLTGQLLECEGTGENSPVKPGNNDTGTVPDSQRWKLYDAGNGFFILQNKLNGKVMDSQRLSHFSWNENNVYYLGQLVTTSEFCGHKSQMWRITEPLPSYTYQSLPE